MYTLHVIHTHSILSSALLHMMHDIDSFLNMQHSLGLGFSLFPPWSSTQFEEKHFKKCIFLLFFSSWFHSFPLLNHIRFLFLPPFKHDYKGIQQTLTIFLIPYSFNAYFFFHRQTHVHTRFSFLPTFST